MFVATLIVSLFLAVALSISAYGKLTRMPAVTTSIEGVGVPPHRIPLLAYLEIAGAIGLVIGLFWWPIGVAAAIGVIAYFVGAVIAHLRIKDTAGVGPAAFLAVLAIAALVLRLATV